MENLFGETVKVVDTSSIKPKVVSDIGEAANNVRRILENRGYVIVAEQPCHYVRKYHKCVHSLIIAERKGRRCAFYVLFKNKFFLTYGRQFDDFGFGESMNLEVLMSLSRSETLEGILYVYNDGFIYNIPVEKFKDFVVEHGTIRVTKETLETTASVRVDLLDRWDIPWTCQTLEAWVHKQSLPEILRRKLLVIVENLKQAALCSGKSFSSLIQSGKSLF
jgi:hypothetical protein